MKQLISVLVAAIFAAASVTVVAQDKKPDDKTKAGQMDKKDKPKSAKSKPAKKKPTKTQKKGEDTKKAEQTK
jgi:Ni/Co efflux regulator RcnB